MSLRRKSGRITNKTLGKFTNTEDDPINLDLAETSKKKVLKRKIKVMPKGETTESEQEKSVVVLEKQKHSQKPKHVKKKTRTPESVELLEDAHSMNGNQAKTEKTGKLKLTDTESEEVEPRVKKGKKNKGIVRKVVYHSVNHLVLERDHLFSLRPGNEVNNQIIDAWAEVLNFEEKYRSTGSPRRLYCGTSAIAHEKIYGVAGTVQLWLFDKWQKEKKPTKLVEEEDLAPSTKIGG
ncbi:hypothetical protein E3N88_30283 [Mikania micrantha]|uniref:Uncharacterized protein n=1 Tax=Mikania micrantha TaxID=192012 RepID=A0A5N6MLC6_9ASTR|nr:hypothetical protein E3N88_30283 [Mikania micrantha]